MASEISGFYFERFDAVPTGELTKIRITDQIQAPAEDIRPTDEGDALRRLQQCLAYLGHLDPSRVDGKRSPATDDAVRAFQKTSGLTVDNDYGKNSRTALRIALGEEVPPPKTKTPTTSPTPVTSVERDPLPPVAPPANGVSYTLEERALAAWHSARIEIALGTSIHGTDTWETGGQVKGKNKNSGPLVDEYITSGGAKPGTDSPWCGHFHGFNYKRAGLNRETLINLPTSKNRRLVFWSTYRLKEFFQRMGRPFIAFPTQSSAKRPKTEADAKAWLRDTLNVWGPQKGDILMCHSSDDYKHVAMVGEYDPDTFELVSYEGNNGNKAGAWRWDLTKLTKTGFFRINAIGRLDVSDFNVDPIVSPSASSPNPVIRAGSGGTTR